LKHGVLVNINNKQQLPVLHCEICPLLCCICSHCAL